MNIQDIYSEITSKHAKHVADLMDGTAYAYVTKQLEALQAAGANLAEYEVVIARDQTPRLIEDENGTTMRINQRIRLMRTEEIQALPLDESALAVEGDV